MEERNTMKRALKRERDQQRPLLDRIESKARRMRALVRSLDAGRLGVTNEQLVPIRQYLELLALELSDGAAGQPSVRTYEERLGWCRRKVQLIRRQVAELGLVRFEQQVCEYTGRTRSSLQTIDWEAIRAGGVSQTFDDAPPGATIAPPGATIAPLRRIVTVEVLQTPPPLSPKNDWQAVADRIAGYGVGEWEKICFGLRSRVTVEHAVAILDWFDARRDSYGVGALALRLRRANAAMPIDSGWPPATQPVAIAKPKQVDEDDQEESRRYRKRLALLAAGVRGDDLIKAMG